MAGAARVVHPPTDGSSQTNLLSTAPESSPSARDISYHADAPNPTNSWARRRILSGSQQLGLPPELAKQVGSLALWYYNRAVLLHTRSDKVSQELSPDTNRYLVPITLTLACENKHAGAGLEQLLRLAGNPTKRTVAVAHRLLAEYRRVLDANRPPPHSDDPADTVRSSSARPRAPATADTFYQDRASPARRPPAPAAGSRLNGAAISAETTSLAVSAPNGLQPVGRSYDDPRPPDLGAAAASRSRRPSTNAWARKRIAELSRRLRLPERVRSRALDFYERIVDLHSKRIGVPAGRRLQLSPRLNWSLVFTTIYLACRFEEYPRDLRDILGRNPPKGLLREMYGLYRFYKRELKLPIQLVDVKTFILSWFDGFEMSDVVHEKLTRLESDRVKKRAIAIANRARAEKTFDTTATKMIAAGAFTTALAERNPPGTRSAFYRAIASFLHMSEETIRYIVARLAELL